MRVLKLAQSKAVKVECVIAKSRDKSPEHDGKTRFLFWDDAAWSSALVGGSWRIVGIPNPWMWNIQRLQVLAAVFATRGLNFSMFKSGRGYQIASIFIIPESYLINPL